MLEGIPYTLLLVILCPIGSVIGSFAQAIVLTIDLESPPNREEDMGIASESLREKRGMWLGLRLILGGILGLVVGLYFVGSIQETPATLAKIVALSIALGYSAPKVWDTQEKIIDKKIKQLSKLKEDD